MALTDSTDTEALEAAFAAAAYADADTLHTTLSSPPLCFRPLPHLRDSLGTPLLVECVRGIAAAPPRHDSGAHPLLGMLTRLPQWRPDVVPLVVNATDAAGRTALHWAAGEGDAATVTWLLAHGADVAAADAAGPPPATAAASGHPHLSFVVPLCAAAASEVVGAPAHSSATSASAAAAATTAAAAAAATLAATVESEGAPADSDDAGAPNTALLWYHDATFMEAHASAATGGSGGGAAAVVVAEGGGAAARDSSSSSSSN